uniref:Uncharacterized protein n=1 Tax=Aegilops tauschii subsp. strangulata TaxID=200361 RepID=A0A453DK38_AEGTS
TVVTTESAMGRSPGPRRGSALLLPLFLLCFFSGATRRAESAREFTLINQCKTEVWPAVTPGESFGAAGTRSAPASRWCSPPPWGGRAACGAAPAATSTRPATARVRRAGAGRRCSAHRRRGPLRRRWRSSRWRRLTTTT